MDEKELEFQIEQKRAERPIRGFTEEELKNLDKPIPMDLWPASWWWLPDGRPRFGEQALDDF